MRNLLTFILFWAGLSPFLQAQSLFAVDSLSGDMFSIDCSSGEITLIRSQPWNLDQWNSLARDSSGRTILGKIPANQFVYSEIWDLDPVTGTTTFVTTVDQKVVNATAFGPNDIFYAAVDINLGSFPRDYRLFTIDLLSGLSSEIGPMGVDFVSAMDFDGSDMYVWTGANGLGRVDLFSGLVTDVNLNFSGFQSLSWSLCFSESGSLFIVDTALWVADANSGVESFVGDILHNGFFGAVEYIPGPEQEMSIWLSDQVGKPTNLECRGATPGAQVAVFYSQRPFGQTVIPNGFPCSGSTLALNKSKLKFAGMVSADAQGSFSLGPKILPQQALYSLQLQALDLSTCTTSNPITVAF